MLRRLVPILLLAAFAAAPMHAQLPLITIPHGALRIELSGAFYPSNDDWLNGTKRPIGSELDGTNNGIVTDLQTRLSALLGAPATGLSIAGLTAVAAREHGVGDIGLAFGLTPRITIFGTLPIVFVRSRVAVTVDSSVSRLGINPGALLIGNAAGQSQTGAFFSQFDAAISTLGTRIAGGSYTDPAQLTLAQQTLSRATTMRAALFSLFADPNHAAVLLPTQSDVLGVQLLSNITALQSTIGGSLGVSGFDAQPALPATGLTTTDFNSLLNTVGGIDLTSPNNLPHYGIGDIRAGVAVQIFSDGTPGGSHWRSAWAQLSATFPNGAPASTTILLDQNVADRHPMAQLSVVGELGAAGKGIRAELGYQRGLPTNISARVTSPENVLAPASSIAALRSTPGDSMSLTVRPFITFAPHLAFTAMAQYWRRSSTTTAYLTGQAPVSTLPPTVLDDGSAANAFVVGFGLSYVYTGQGRDGSNGLPVEAGWSVERTVASGSGFFPVSLTSRVMLRIYRPLVRH